ncbi:MAG TPA: hypothetical protein VH682_13495, partial [Gemmataceae bacterium]
MRNRLAVFLSVTVLVPVWTTAHGEETGSIRGRVDKIHDVTAVFAINRENDKKYPAVIDAKQGQFVIKDLPLGATYDCVLDAGPVRRLEGVNLKVPRSDYEEEQPLTKEDRETIEKTARSLNKFENEIEVLTISGNIQYAAVVL